MNHKDILMKGLAFRDQIKVLHWQTDNNNRHILFGDLYDLFEELNDLLMLVIMGKLEKKISVGLIAITLKDVSELDALELIKEAAAFYQSAKLFLADPCIDNILALIVNMLRRKLYLYRQK